MTLDRRHKNTSAKADPKHDGVATDAANPAEEAAAMPDDPASADVAADARDADASAIDRARADGNGPSNGADEGDTSATDDHVDELTALRGALQEAQDEKLRLLAEFQNYRRRAARDTLAAKREGMAELVAALTPALHTLDLAIASTRATSATIESIVGGVDLVRKSVHDALADLDIQRVEPLGETFEAETMDALGHFPSELPEGHVSQVVQSGWRIGDRLIKPAQVLVSNGTPPTDESDSNVAAGDDSEEGR